MKLENNKIVEATEDELYKYWIKSSWCDFMDFNEYKRRCENNGTKIVEEG